jgi:hypothetical protein
MAKTPSARAEYLRAWNKRNPEKRRLYEHRRSQTRHGITLDQRDALLGAQGNVCASCKNPNPGSKLGWHTDHDHITDKIRGILCHQCNLTLGLVKDNPVHLYALAYYLEKQT